MKILRFFIFGLSLIIPVVSIKVRLEAMVAGQTSMLGEKGGGQGPSVRG